MNKQIDRALASAITKRENQLRRQAQLDGMAKQIADLNTKVDGLTQALTFHLNALTDSTNKLTERVSKAVPRGEGDSPIVVGEKVTA